MAVILVFTVIFAAALTICYINHRVHLAAEEGIITPMGTAVNMNGRNINVYTEGEGDTAIVFMSGGGTCSPVLDFKSCYSLLSGEHSVAVIEKTGYGFSDVADIERDIDSLISDDRAALARAGVNAPYILCPHSMSGPEALYRAQKYPEEVLAIVGLDMAVPEYYDEMKINIPLIRLAGLGANVGATRFIPGLSESDAIKHGTLTEEEKALYRAVFYRRTVTKTMIRETEAVKGNAEKVKTGGVPQVPMLLFVSDGKGTGFEKDPWRSIAKEYAAEAGGVYRELDCPHYVHNYEYEKIAGEIKGFISQITDGGESEEPLHGNASAS